jgi:hypothetical protein
MTHHRLTIALVAFLFAAAASAQHLAPPPGTVRWGQELPPIEQLMAMPKDQLTKELERATALPVTASYRTASQALVLRALALKDPRVAPALVAFPVRVVVAPEPTVTPIAAQRLQSAIVKVLNDIKLPAVEGDAPRAGELFVDVDIIENDRTDSILGNTGMHSYGIRIAGALRRPDGTLQMEFGSVRSALGTTMANAAAKDFDRNAAAHCSELVDQLARYALSLP